MGIKFSAGEILEVAKKIEANGAAFYRKAAEQHPSGHNKEFLNELAAMEDVHKAIFTSMQSRLTKDQREETSFDPMDEMMLYLAAMADLHGGEGTPSAADRLTGKESMEDILMIAIELEKKSILFYMGIEDLVPADMGREKIGGIIEEEKKHVVTLSRELNRVRTGKA